MSQLMTRLMVVTSLLSAMALAGCNTVEGAGKDIERAGEKVQTANCSSADSANDPACKK
jgi:predicted small secreted protein